MCLWCARHWYKVDCCGAASLAFRAEGGTWPTCSGMCARGCACVWVYDVSLPEWRGVTLAHVHSFLVSTTLGEVERL